ncbi:hypothetical protein ACPOL_6627 [Acidisarcina polymorpha]|uniref:Uncharacterized protein n=1 Tax=Acidisarcina polymorpha TaxID=2211140 RepID=A0A2Z5G9Y8_9BACT|nr:hypothetical protein ACPOL_6627 [Acidisarcina polymorpha]
MSHSTGHSGNVVHIGFWHHRGHGGIRISSLKFAAAVTFPKFN